MSVQCLSPEYIKTVNPQQVQQWVEQGYVKKQGNQYFVTANSSMTFPEGCFVKNTDGQVKTYKMNPKGTIVERTTPTGQGEVVGTPQKLYSATVSNIIERMGLTDDNLKAEFNKFLASQQGLTVDESGNITFSDVNALNTALSTFAQQHQANFVDPNAQKYVEFTQNSDQEIISKLGTNGAIDAQPTEQGGRRYAVKNEQQLTGALTEQVGETTYEASNARSATLEAGLTTTTTTREGAVVTVPENLRDNRAGRKQLRTDAQQAYAELVANADPELRDAIDLYIAERRYNGKIEKRMNELLEYTTTMGGTKEKKATRDGADIVQLYIDNYASKDDKDKLNNLVTQIQNSQNPNDQQKILEALKGANIIGADTNFANLPDSLKRKGALICMAQAQGLDSQNLLRLMATYDVMSSRSTEQVLNDDRYFIEQQAKDYVKNQQAGQDISNTTVYFSKHGRKNAPEDGKIHTDIGKKGRDLVRACPEMLGDEVTDNNTTSRLQSLSDKQLEEQGYVKATIDGQVKYFKFSQEKWQTFMGLCCDPTRATDAEMNVLFGDDETRKQRFLDDLNLTLQEGRSVLEMNLPSPYGQTGTLQFANIIGNNNGKIDNSELNALRDMTKSAGYSVDGNSTYGKRLLHVLKNTGIGAGLGILTGGMGSLLSGAVNIAGTTAAQTITLNGPVSLTDDVTLRYTDQVTTTDVTNTIVGNETFTSTTTHITDVSGTTTGQATLTGDASLTDQVDGQNYRDSGNNHVNTAVNAGILGGIAGGVRGLTTMKGVHERGRNIDDVFNLTRLVEHEDTEDTNVSIQIPQFYTVETRSGTMEVGTEIQQKPAVKWRYLNAYASLYNLPAEVSEKDFVEAYRTALNLPAGTMPRNDNGRDIFVALPEITINGTKYTLKDNWVTLYDQIPQGTQGSGRGQKVTIPQGKRTVHAQGTIRS